ncbi:Na[+]/H[+] hydrogen antiporter 1 [Trypanosoma grayi]|uniref:Na[+]/H[+] hydrogen antiporter 1 n=1 Tax=Trypanosoma grayi TaxID=71804 RepID=UPI0004F409A4|nr:Na[+]/H[+] hydrogen antiporter 1 [Trypanosoma grayi]KEG09529.1 Na[+]/H[+] hydrogen antiporter 1 [Trypanosoma grayi]
MPLQTEETGNQTPLNQLGQDQQQEQRQREGGQYELRDAGYEMLQISAEESPREPIHDDVCRQSQHTASSALNMSILRGVPEHLHPLARQIHTLNDADLVVIAAITDNVATRDVYSLLPYTGSNWFLPQISEVGEGEPHWGIHCSSYGAFNITLGGRRMFLPVTGIFLRILVIVLFWFTLWNILPHWLMEPSGYVWDPLVLVVVAAIVGGLLCRLLQIPPLAGVLWIAIMWNNIPHEHYLTEGIVLQVKDISSKMGLTVIMARAGYSLTIKGIIPHWKQSILLATMPFAFEGVAHSLIANKIFKYEDNYQWAFLQGMVCSIVSPAVVVPGTLYLQEMGYGRGVGPLSLMLSAVGVEIVLGVWTANFIIGLLFHDQNLAVAIVLGPVQFIGGIIIGIIIGVAFFYFVEILKNEAERLPNGHFQKKHFYGTLDFATFVFLLLAFSMVFLGYSLNLAGGGCTMCVFFASTVTHFCLKDGNPELEEQKKYIGSWLAFVWDNAMMPFLFAMMGAKINIGAIFNSDFFPKAIVCLICSTVVRLVVTLVIQLGSGTPWQHKLLVCAGYTGKASAQASLGPIAAALVAAELAKLPPDVAPTAELLKRREYANNVQQMSAMYVMFMAAVASLSLVRGGMALLPRVLPPERKRRWGDSSVEGPQPEESDKNVDRSAEEDEARGDIAGRNNAAGR